MFNSEEFLLKSLEEHYEIGAAKELVPMSTGRTSEACRIVTEHGDQYVLRRLRSNQQAVCEYEISSIAAANHMSPYILPGRHTNGCIEVQGNLYNLQLETEQTTNYVHHIIADISKYNRLMG
ncbi:hypothetical protein [Paenibacillus urinalis]|uniref:hypothetical protein n=1 Tax=Paenibacillus urinalis TaxID=521520 RepID=UPI001960B977